MVKNNDLLTECLRQQKASEEGEQEERPSWRDKPLHEMYHSQTEEVADKDNIPVSREGWSQGQHRDTDHGSKRSIDAWSTTPDSIQAADCAKGLLKQYST